MNNSPMATQDGRDYSEISSALEMLRIDLVGIPVLRQVISDIRDEIKRRHTVDAETTRNPFTGVSDN